MPEPRRLVDTSVLGRTHQRVVAERLEALALAGKLWTCRMIDLEYLYSQPEHGVPDVLVERRALPESPITDRTMDRALEIMEKLAVAGMHRHARVGDCIIAASAMQAGISVLHYDRDFERIAEVVGLEAEWVAPAGSLD
jgi:predicted nucleic acid-binding protein